MLRSLGERWSGLFLPVGSLSFRSRDTVSATQPPRRGLVVALHCSGAGASQWRRLGAELGGDYELVAPEHYGCENIGAWTGEHAFTLADEAARTIALIDSCDRKVHLVGHSYGGGLALHIALKRPNRIASLALYEPSAFYLLNLTETGEHAAFQEIVAITRETGNGVITRDYRAGEKAQTSLTCPPSTWRMYPVTNTAESRYITASTTRDTSPIPPIGCSEAS